MGFLLISGLTLSLLGLGLRLGYKLNLSREKISPFECGVTPKFSARLPFSIRFFIIAIIFLVFDVELILIFPIIPALTNSCIIPLFTSILLIILILILGLFHEIFQGSLSWAN